jgi:hypothetical protein
MRFIERIEVEEWCRMHGIALAEDGRLIDDPTLVHCESAFYAEGQRSGREPAVAAACVQAPGEWEECLLWVRVWGVWPSGEDWPACRAARYRR